MGRADQSTKVKGMFVHPSQVNQVAARHPAILKARLEVTSRDNLDVMTLRCEVGGSDATLVQTIAETLESVCRVRGEIVLARPGELPNDGKIIADLRTYK